MLDLKDMLEKVSYLDAVSFVSIINWINYDLILDSSHKAYESGAKFPYILSIVGWC